MYSAWYTVRCPSGSDFFKHETAQVFELYRTAKTLTTRPSALLGVDPDDVWLAFEIDHAVTGLGLYIESKLEEYDDHGKRRYPSLAAVLATRRLKPRTPKPPPPPKRADAPKRELIRPTFRPRRRP